LRFKGLGIAAVVTARQVSSFYWHVVAWARYYFGLDDGAISADSAAKCIFSLYPNTGNMNVESKIIRN
jgi:SNF family Na+-dependent transporter